MGSGLAATGGLGLELISARKELKWASSTRVPPAPPLPSSTWAPTVSLKSPENFWANPEQERSGKRAPFSCPGSALGCDLDPWDPDTRKVSSAGEKTTRLCEQKTRGWPFLLGKGSRGTGQRPWPVFLGLEVCTELNSVSPNLWPHKTSEYNLIWEKDICTCH